jgi:Nif-specific regulatory protein
VDVQHGYLALYDDGGGAGWSIAHGLSHEEVEGVRRVVSQGIIAQALATGQTIVTPSAQADTRFNMRDSVRLRHIEAVLCAPIGAPPRGICTSTGSSGPRLHRRGAGRRRDVRPSPGPPGRPRPDAAPGAIGEDATRAARERLRLDGLIGRSRALAAVLEQVALVAPLDVSVLLTGDNGTGKSQLARIIHDNSRRAAHAFVSLNCAAIPRT